LKEFEENNKNETIIIQKLLFLEDLKNKWPEEFGEEFKK
jgi:hypothetical protein